MVAAGPVKDPRWGLDDLARHRPGRGQRRSLPMLADGTEDDEHDQDGGQRHERPGT
jgi:hypothetical protein